MTALKPCYCGGRAARVLIAGAHLRLGKTYLRSDGRRCLPRLVPNENLRPKHVDQETSGKTDEKVYHNPPTLR